MMTAHTAPTAEILRCNESITCSSKVFLVVCINHSLPTSAAEIFEVRKVDSEDSNDRTQ